MLEIRHQFRILIGSQFSREGPQCSLTPTLVTVSGMSHRMHTFQDNKKAEEHILGQNPLKLHLKQL